MSHSEKLISFLSDCHLHHTGFPILGIEWQKMENPDLRTSMRMKADQKGVRIRRMEPTSPESLVLKPSDVILSFDGVNIANDGTGMDLCSLFKSLCIPVLFGKCFITCL